MSEYARVLFLAGIVPLLFSFWPSLQFYRNGRGLAMALAVIVLLFGGWDVWATARGHWSFAPGAVSSVRVFNLPLEEVLFFVVIPFCVIFTWEAMNYFFPQKGGRA